MRVIAAAAMGGGAVSGNRRLRPENPSLRVMREIVLASSVQSDIF